MRANNLSYIIVYIIIFQSISLSLSAIRHNKMKIELKDNWDFQLNGGEWQKVSIPHDYTIIQKFNQDLEAENGYTPGGTAIYKTSFILNPEDKELTHILYFSGIYKDSYIKINNIDIGENHYGYNSFYFDISEFIKRDGETPNVIEVKVVHDLFSSRWYSGSGMLRGVFLISAEPLHIDVDGIKITTPDIKSGKGTVDCSIKIVNMYKNDSKIKLKIEIKNASDGKLAAETLTEENMIEKNTAKEFKAKLLIEKPLLWSAENPNLYELEVKVINEDNIIDNDSAQFGFRYFSFDNKKGFIINGIPTKLKGACLHHDYGALGAIDNYDAAYKRLTQLKDMGINAIRTSHNIANKCWIEISDKIGLYVIEEFFDGWTTPKGDNKEDFSKYFKETIKSNNKILGGSAGMTWSEFSVASTVKRDKNNPSIIMWSIGNEIKGIDGKSADLGKNLMLVAKKIDETRPFTRGDDKYRRNNSAETALNNAIVNQWGIIGFNYAKKDELLKGAESYGAIYLSESASALNSRGVYSNIQNGGSNKKHDGAFHLTSYDVSYASWSTTANYAIWVTLSQDYVSGAFVWTGYDYIGEPTPWNDAKMGSQTGKGAIPNAAYFGVIDTAGFPKDTYYLYRSQYNINSYTLHIVNAWDKNNICFSDEKGTKTPVHIYSNVPKYDIYRSDKDEPICSGTRKKITTTAGYSYFTYEGKSHDENICQVIPSSDNDPGTVLFVRYNILFDDKTALYAKAFNENGELIDEKNISGNQYIATPNINKLKLEINLDKDVIVANGRSLAYIEVSVVDDKGVLNSMGDDVIYFNIEDEIGKILGVDNGDQATEEKFQQKKVLLSENSALIRLYRGKALAIIASDKEGVIKLEVSSEKYGKESLEIKAVLEK